MYQVEKDERGAFWATYFNAATNNLLSVVQYLGGERRHWKDRNVVAMPPEEQNMDGLQDNGYEAIQNCAVIQELRKTGICWDRIVG